MELTGKSNPEVLSFAANENRIVLTHDVRTFSKFAYERVANKELMPGVFEANQDVPVAVAIFDLALLAECSEPREWECVVPHLPL